MFKTRESTPRYYTNTSRDFQLLGHLLDCVVSNVRQGVSGMTSLPLNKNIDENLLTLVQTTLGLNLTHKYSSNSLLAVCSDFKNILKLKGTKSSIEECVKVLLNAQNLKDEYDVSVYNLVETSNNSDDGSSYHVDIRISESMQDIELLDDLLNYILPAGYTYSIIKTKVKNASLTTQLVEGDKYTNTSYNSRELSEYSSKDELLENNYGKLLSHGMSEVGMTTVVSANDFNVVDSSSTISAISDDTNEDNK